jgi:hypothetical protein
MRRRSKEVISQRAVLRVLFLGSRSVPAGQADVDEVRAFIDSASLIDLASAKDAEPVQKLYMAWLKARTSKLALKTGLGLSLYVPIPDVLPFARSLADDKTTDVKVLSNVLLILGNRGDATDFKRLLASRDDSRLMQESIVRTVANRVEVETKQSLLVKDAAVGMTLKLGGEDPENYGFDTFETIAWWFGTKPAPHLSIGPFATDDARTKAHAKSKEWLDKKAKEIAKEPKPEAQASFPLLNRIVGWFESQSQ